MNLSLDKMHGALILIRDAGNPPGTPFQCYLHGSGVRSCPIRKCIFGIHLLLFCFLGSLTLALRLSLRGVLVLFVAFESKRGRALFGMLQACFTPFEQQVCAILKVSSFGATLQHRPVPRACNHTALCRTFSLGHDCFRGSVFNRDP